MIDNTDKEVVHMKTEPFSIMFALHEQRVQDDKNHLDFLFNMRKKEMENAMIEAEYMADFRYKQAQINNQFWYVKPVVYAAILIILAFILLF